MPTYCFYREEKGRRVTLEKTMTPKQLQFTRTPCGQYRIDGKLWCRDFKAEQVGVPSTEWPMYSNALGVAPQQVEEATKNSHEAGVPTEYLPDGRAIIRSREHRRKLAKALGMVDFDAGYSDPQ